jgi:alpha-L-fucosidase
VYVNTIKELFAAYGPIWELWWDGANGEGPNGKKQEYDWNRFKKTVRDISPNTVVFSDVGPQIRWVGNERGIAGKTNWNYLDTAGYTPGAGSPPLDTLNSGNAFGRNWIPSECDVSIRPGWFYHAEEDDKVKTGRQLFDLYLKSVGRGSNLLLNVPPDRRGLIHENDSASLMVFKRLRDESFSNNLVTDETAREIIDGRFLKDSEEHGSANEKLKSFRITLSEVRQVNCIVLREAIQNGQTIERFTVRLYNGEHETGEINGTTIGRKRILTFPAKTITSFTVTYLDRRGSDNLWGVEAYHIDGQLIEIQDPDHLR